MANRIRNEKEELLIVDSIGSSTTTTFGTIWWDCWNHFHVVLSFLFTTYSQLLEIMVKVTAQKLCA